MNTLQVRTITESIAKYEGLELTLRFLFFHSTMTMTKLLAIVDSLLE